MQELLPYDARANMAMAVPPSDMSTLQQTAESALGLKAPMLCAKPIPNYRSM